MGKMDGMIEPIITADDVVRAGACAEGVAKFCQRFDTKLAAAMPVSLALLLTSESESESELGTDENENLKQACGYVMKAAYDDYGHCDGYGDGDGDGDGCGYGYTDGYGYAVGYGFGYADC
jgi:hypothetical protein